MDFAFNADETDLKDEISEFARRELPPDVADEIADFEGQFHGRPWEIAREIMPKAGARGWLGPGWPTQYGGRQSSAMKHVICQEELAYWGIPGCDMGVGGISWIGPSLLTIGTEAQKMEHLPPITQGRRFWCTAYSEPGAGSDMASLKSRAVRKGDGYIINGQKVWTSAGPVADWCWLLVRTNPDVPKHRGLSLFLLDLQTKGVRIRPLPAMTGAAPFAELFLDDVYIPRHNLVGDEDCGWNHVVSALEYERSFVGILFTGIVRRIVDDLAETWKKSPDTAGGSLTSQARHKLAEIAIEAEISRLLAYRAALLLWSGRPSNVESATSKVFSTELSQRAAQFAMEAAGLYGQFLGSTGSFALARRAVAAYLSCPGNTILAGTSEIERNVIAQRGFGLPR